MKRDTAYGIAVSHLNAMGVNPVECFSERLDDRPTSISDPHCEENPTQQPDVRKVWGFAFTLISAGPGEIVSGGGCVVSVDDISGECSVFAGL
jgi:hypothetical protein